MTRTRWTAACAAVLLLGGSAALAQESSYHPGDCRNNPCRPQTAEAPRAPYYYEMPQLLYPAGGSPDSWARLFEAVAKCRAEASNAPASEGARDKARRESRDRRMACELLRLYRLFYREGHYKAAEIVADRALSIDPCNPAAEHALAMARIAAGVIDRAASGDAEDCTEGADKDSVNNALPMPRCGMCLPTQGAAKHGCKAAAKASCACGADCCCDTDKSSCKCGNSCPCSKACACGADCCCDTDKSACKCGDSCACKKSERQNVRRRHRERNRLIRVPPCMPMPGAAMMPPCPMGMPCPCPGMMPGQGAMMPPGMPMPPSPWMPPPPNAVMSWPVQPGWHCNPADWNTGLVQYKPGFPEPLPMPREVLPAPLPHGTLTVSTTARRSPPVVQMCVSGRQIQIISPCLEAYCDSVNSLADGRVLLDGNVTVIFHVVDRPAKIVAPRMIVDLEDGSYEVNPSAATPLFRPVSFLDDPFSVIKKAADSRYEKPLLGGCTDEVCPVPTPANRSVNSFWGSGPSGLEIRY